MKDAPSNVVSIAGTLTRSGYDTVQNQFAIANDTATCNFNNVAAGTWHLQVNAYDASNTLTYTGATDVQVSPGVATPVYLVLDPATGSILVTVTWGTNGTSSNKSLLFDGISGYVDIKASPSFVNIDSALTLEAWIKPEIDPNHPRYYNYIICNGVSAVGYTMEFLSPGSSFEPAFTLNGLTIDYTGASDYWTRLVLNQTVPANTWTHMAVTYKYGQGINVYINGVIAHHADASGILSPPNQNLRIGVLLNSVYQLYFKGLIDEVRIWNIARSATDIQNNMSKELTGSEAGLVGYWNCDDSPSSSTLSDKTIYGNNGTLNGGVSFSSDTPF